ncbi:MAG: hypothetical protein Kow00109_29680 [Acidobacteriota bacterium]
MTRKSPFRGLGDMPELAISLGRLDFNRTGAWRYLRPTFADRPAPCHVACPAGNFVPQVLHAVSQGELTVALDWIRRTNPFPALTGRVCYEPCRRHCSRSRLDEPVSVKVVERALGELALDTPHEVFPEARTSACNVAVVGSGPAGLACACFLARHGVGVTVYERETALGGMLRIGIPTFRLPRLVLDREIELLSRLGVRFVTGAAVGRDLSLEELQQRYAAVFVATGAHRARRINLECRGRIKMWAGLDFLRAVNFGHPPEVGPEVVVVGGGNTAIDAARCARRLGAKVSVVYRRTEAEMPADPAEVAAAREEGVSFRFLLAPAVAEASGEAMRLICHQMQLGAPDASGRRRPEPLQDRFAELAATALILAVGEEPSIEFFRPLPRVLLGGDAASGPATVPAAIRSGREAAAEILELVGEEWRVSLPRLEGDPVDPEELRWHAFSVQPPMRRPGRPGVSLEDFGEVDLELSPEAARQEAERCLSCGTCNSCGTCWWFCPEAAVHKADGRYAVDLDYCKGCGICAQECPRGVVRLTGETA